MPTFSSKELYMMNGGNKLYIYKDGFGDVYNATPDEEAEWSQEVVANALALVNTEKNKTSLKFAIDNLLFHHYKDIETLLHQKLKESTPSRQTVFATALWTTFGYTGSFDILYRILIDHRSECLDDVFHGLIEFKKHPAARTFLLACLAGDDDVLLAKACTTIGMWAYTGLPELRQNDLHERLRPELKHTPTFQLALEELRKKLAMD